MWISARTLNVKGIKAAGGILLTKKGCFLLFSKLYKKAITLLSGVL